MNDFLANIRPIAHNAWRIVIGFTFFTHGGQKLLGWFGRDPVSSFASMSGVAGFLEFFGGIAIMLGVRTQYVAFVLSGEMAVAYWYRHVGNGGLWHWANGGELAAVYCLTFLMMSTVGGGDFSVDGVPQEKELTTQHAGNLAPCRVSKPTTIRASREPSFWESQEASAPSCCSRRRSPPCPTDPGHKQIWFKSALLVQQTERFDVLGNQQEWFAAYRFAGESPQKPSIPWVLALRSANPLSRVGRGSRQRQQDGICHTKQQQSQSEPTLPLEELRKPRQYEKRNREDHEPVAYTQVSHLATSM